MSKSPSSAPGAAVTAERKFIHDLSTPLTTAQLLLENTIEKLTQVCSQTPNSALQEELGQLSRVQEVLKKLSFQLQERRSILIAASQKAEDQPNS